MDDVDAAEASQARNILLSGDWVTQHLNGIRYFDKAPLKYWITAGLYELLGVHDWVARLPTAIAALLLCWLVLRIGAWAESPEVGVYSAVVLATSIGLFLFTRTIIPDVLLTFFITLSFWCFLRLLESPRRSLSWALGMYASIGLAVLTKGLIGVVFPVGIAVTYLLVTRFTEWRKLHLVPGLLLLLAITLPWHILAAVRNPPLLDFTLNAGPHFGGQFRGFFWFYFINEQLLRFLNQRWPHDYNTVPRIWFWLYQVLWFLPWSFFLPVAAKLNFKPVDRASRVRLLVLCWIGAVMLFFSFSTTQEYYSMPAYPAIALLLGSAMATSGKWLNAASRAAGFIWLAASALVLLILIKVWSLPTPGDIYAALSPHPELYTLALGHAADLTLPALAYLKLPLELAGLAFLAGGLGMLLTSGWRAYVAIALSLLVFFHAARLALIVFDPYLSSHAIAERLNHLPKGTLIISGHYNQFSSLFFYSQDRALQNDASLDILEYGSMAPGAPKISVTDEEMKCLWSAKSRAYLVTKTPDLQHVLKVLGSSKLLLLFQSGDKYLLTNQPAREMTTRRNPPSSLHADPQAVSTLCLK